MSPLSRQHVLQHPERIHPSLWRAAQLARPSQAIAPTGYPQLDACLPGGGWPVGTLIEILPAQAGMGELQLLKPALSRREPGRSLVLLNPPYMPSVFCLNQWFSSKYRVVWIRSINPDNTLWAAEKILQHDACTALLCWISEARAAALRRLQLAARQTSALFFGLRPVSAATQASAAPLRLSLKPSVSGLTISVLKRRGPALATDIPLFLHESSDLGLEASNFENSVAGPVFPASSSRHVPLVQHLS